MKKDALTKLADYVQSGMSAEMEAGTFAGIFVVFMFEDDSIKRMKMPDEVGRFLDSKEGKQVFYMWLRMAVRGMNATGCATGSDAWFAVPTEAAEKLASTREEWDALMDLGTKELANRGLVTRKEALMVLVQTRTEFMTRNVAYTRAPHGLVFEEAVDHRASPDNFGGLAKVF